MQHKVHQLRGLGLEFIAEPDVPSAGGLDLLQQFLYEKVVKLNEPSARKYQLRPPRGMLLLGPPDKGFTGWQEGGVSRRLSQRLLTWMQEHTSNVMLMATVNRIKLLPSEIKRRFDDGGIWFVDLPDMGAISGRFSYTLVTFIILAIS